MFEIANSGLEYWLPEIKTKIRFIYAVQWWHHHTKASCNPRCYSTSAHN
jgi:hypothetical protein